jgi:uncharacterized membrane protein
MFIDRLLKPDPSMKRHVAKTITWRIIGTIDTMALGWLISGDPMIGVKIGGVEAFTKMVLYFFHERAWYRINYGLPHRAAGKSEKNSGQLSEAKVADESTAA